MTPAFSPALAEESRDALIESARLANKSDGESLPFGPGNLSGKPPGQAPPASFAASEQFPLYFVGNQGQVNNDQVSHYIQGRDRTIYFAPGGVTFALLDGGPPASSLAADSLNTSRWVVKLDFLDSNSLAQPTGEQRTPAVVSYFKGPAPARLADLPTFAELVYSDLWPGIDLVYTGTVQRLKYTFFVAPGADASRIRLAYRGADVHLTSGGRLGVSTPFGGFQDAKPFAYQEIDGQRVEVKADFALQSESGTSGQTVVFQLGAYDSALPLVIDPSLVVYAGSLLSG